MKNVKKRNYKGKIMNFALKEITVEEYGNAVKKDTLELFDVNKQQLENILKTCNNNDITQKEIWENNSRKIQIIFGAHLTDDQLNKIIMVCEALKQGAN